MKRSKLPHLLLVMSVAAAMALSACGNGNNSANTGNADKTASPDSSATASPDSSAASELEPYTVSLYFPGSPQKDQAVVEEKMKELLADKLPNTSVQLNYIDWGAYNQKTNLMLQTGEPIDLLFAPEWNSFFTNAAKGAYLPLNDDSLEKYGNLLAQYGKGISETINPTYLKGPVLDGKLYAIPTNKELAQGRGFAFRKDIVEKYGFDIQSVKTLKDVEPFLEVIKEKEPGIYPAYSNKQDSLIDWVQDYGYQDLGNGTYINRTVENSPVISITSDEYMKVELNNYQVIHDWYTKGYLNKNAPTTQEKIDDVRAAGKIWFLSTTTSPGRAEAMRIKNTSGNGPEYYDWDVVTVQQPLVTTSAATGSQIAIARSSKDPARAMMVLDLLYTDKELLNTLVYGIEGKHFTKVADNKIQLIADSGYNPGNSWMVGNQLNNYLLDNEADNKYEEYVTFNETAEQSPLLGFTFNPDPVKTEVASYSTIIEQYRDILRTGPVDPVKALNERNEKIDKSGHQKIVEEVQKQLDAWKQSNGK